METVLFYTLRDGVDRARLMEIYPQHKAFYEAFQAGGGGLVALGPFGAPDAAGGSMGIFTSREEAERFIAGDPFVSEGLADPRIVDWNAVRFD
ncbi:YciI family protein [Smaragdicoccus niigatensis]|uniref:YciI family protein n=1 Tax=Smaragdicoccus niigatensis TaxID=359359 RepID=UPI00037DCF2D|nr:YciI family protein [Smaragdicoccus niigatensis]